jgi:hypothetical protein
VRGSCGGGLGDWRFHGVSVRSLCSWMGLGGEIGIVFRWGERELVQAGAEPRVERTMFAD